MWSPRWVRSTLIALLPLLAALPAQAGKLRIAVLAVTVEHAAPEVQRKLEAAVAGGLAASGADVVDSAATARRSTEKGLGQCETSTCLAAVAEATGARYLIRGRVELVGRNYAVHLEMLDGLTGGPIDMREDRCEICTETEAYETASVAASALKAQVSKRRLAPGAGGVPAGSAAASRVASDASGGSGRSPAGPSSALVGEVVTPAPAPRWRALPVIGLAAGALAIGAGVYLLAINGQGTCRGAPGDVCEFQYQTRAGGITLVSVGALAAAVGTTLLVGRF
jgi:hypothetical protein